jgi:hypothetical protein
MKPTKPTTESGNDPINSAMEESLRRALQPVDPPAGFAERVIRRANARRAPRAVSGPLVRWATAAALVVSVSAVSGGLWYRAEERRRAQGEEARRQVLQSLEIAGARLRAVQMKINRQGESQQ